MLFSLQHYPKARHTLSWLYIWPIHRKNFCSQSNYYTQNVLQCGYECSRSLPKHNRISNKFGLVWDKSKLSWMHLNDWKIFASTLKISKHSIIINYRTKSKDNVSTNRWRICFIIISLNLLKMKLISKPLWIVRFINIKKQNFYIYYKNQNRTHQLVYN